MVKAYVLIVTDPGRTRHVTEALSNVTHVQAVSEGYPWHYVVPFDRLGGCHGSSVSTRAGAWNARESAR